MPVAGESDWIMLYKNICRVAAWVYYTSLRLALNPNLPELIQIAKTSYDFACLLLPWLPLIPG